VQRILVINGANTRSSAAAEGDGPTTLADVDRVLANWGQELDIGVDPVHASDDDAVLHALLQPRADYDGVILSRGTGAGPNQLIADALAHLDVPFVEVDPTSAGPRSAGRGVDSTTGYRIHGRGLDGYRWALRHLVYRAAWPVTTHRSNEHPDRVADLRLPDRQGPHPIMVLYHGGFWREHWTRDLMDGLAVDLVQRGRATWNVEYRRIPPLGGWRTSMQDAADAVDALQQFGSRSALDLDDVTLLGHSAGSQLAVMAAVSARMVRPRRVVSLAGVLDIAAVYDATDPENGPNRFLGSDGPAAFRSTSPIEQVPTGVRQLVVHGTRDDVVPIDVSRTYAAVAGAAGDDVETLWLNDVGHMEVIEPDSDAWTAVAARL